MPIVISSEDQSWLADNYPGLVCQNNSIAGIVSFTATYDSESNLFLIMRDGEDNSVGGIVFSCEYQIRIETREKLTYSTLPAVYVEEIDRVDERHFGYDGSACLCSPLQEREFLFPTFNFPKFFAYLVVPFLYGQSFYTRYNRWPWLEYAHGTAGLLESFGDEEGLDQDAVRNFLAVLAVEKRAWPNVRAALDRDQIKGHTPCFCPKHDQIRRCHPKALIGIRKLQHEIKEHSLLLPSTT